MSGRTQWLLVGLACLFFLTQELPLRQTRWVEDESWHTIPAYTLMTEGKLRNPTFVGSPESRVEVYPPGQALLLQPVFRLFGTGIIQARLLCLAAGLGVVVLTFLLGRELAGPFVGVAAAFLVATDNLLFLAGRTARQEALVTLCGVLSVWVYLRSRKHDSLWLTAVSGMLIGIGMTIHPNGAAGGAAVAGLILLESPLRFWRQPRTWVFGLGALVAFAPYLLWAHLDPVRRQIFWELDALYRQYTLLEKLRLEFTLRYKDFLQFPYRVHIALLLLSAFAVLWIKNRRLFGLVTALAAGPLIVILLSFNKNVRYMATLSPVFAIAVAAAAAELRPHRAAWRAGVAACVLYGLSQVGGNLFVLYKFRKADYKVVGRELQALIPPNESVYGAMTFWLALHDRTYYSYERTPFDLAVNHLHPSYLILNDRVMVKGMRQEIDWADLRTQANAFAKQHAELVGHISNPFYGELDVYRVRYGS